MSDRLEVHYSSKNDPGLRLELDVETCVRELASLDVPGALIQVGFSGGTWVDFYAEGSGSFWMEIYEAARLSAATVSLAVARDILRAAANDFGGRTAEDCLSDLNIEWDYICGA